MSLLGLLGLVALASASEPQPAARASATEIAAPASDRGPIPIHKSLPVPPIETAGTNVTPSVSVKVTVDERGRVANVAIRGIRPSTQYDAFYEREVRKSLNRWRFAPALKEGKPVRMDLDWTLSFERRTSGSSSAASDVSMNWRQLPSLIVGGQSFEWDAYVASLPSDARTKVLERLCATADAYLVGDKTTEFNLDSTRVVTDAPNESIAARVARNISAAKGALDLLFGEKIPPQAPTEKLFAYVFATEASFNALTSELEAPSHIQGCYREPGLLMIHLQLQTSDDLVRTLLHESVHAYMNRYIVRPGVALPVWIAEGLAEYLENSDIQDGTIRPGGHTQHSRTLKSQNFTWLGPSTSHLGAAEVKNAVRGGTAIPLGEVISADRSAFYGKKYNLFYTQSWMFIHFLMNGKPSWGKEEFPRFLLYVAEGYPAPSAFRAVYGCEASSLEQDFKKYIDLF